MKSDTLIIPEEFYEILTKLGTNYQEGFVGLRECSLRVLECYFTSKRGYNSSYTTYIKDNLEIIKAVANGARTMFPVVLTYRDPETWELITVEGQKPLRYDKKY